MTSINHSRTGRRRVLAALALAAIIGGGLATVFLLTGDRYSDSPYAPRGESSVVERSDGSTVDATTEARTVESEATASESVAQTVAESEAPPSPPLLEGTVRGEGAPIEGAVVLLVATREVEETIRRLSSRGPGDVLEAATRIPEILSAARQEIERLRREAETAETDAEGAYTFHEVSPRSYFVLVTATEWLFDYGDVVALRADRTETLDVTLHRGSTIAGRVVDARGVGVPGVVVTAEIRPAGESGVGRLIQRAARFINGEILRGAFEQVSGEDGSFTLTSLPPGTYDLAARKPAHPEVRLEEVETGTLSALIYIGDSAWVEGDLVDGSGIPAAGVQLELEDLTSKFTLPLPLAGFNDVATNVYRWLGDEKPLGGASDPSGAFRLGPLSAGTYRLVCREPGFLPLKRTFSVSWGERHEIGVLYLDRGSEIRGVVLDRDGVGLAGAEIVAVPARMNPLMAGGAISDFVSRRMSAVSGEDGQFRLSGLGKESYRVTAHAAGYARAMTDPIEAGSPESVVLRLRPGVELVGVVRTQGGEPLGGADVRVEQNATTTDAEGRFVLDGVTPASDLNPFEGPGRAAQAGGAGSRGADGDIAADNGPDTEVTVRASARGFRASTAVVDLSAPLEDLEITLGKAPVISGRVLTPAGDPAPASLVRLTPDMPEDVPFLDFVDPGMIFLAATVSGPDGAFRLPAYQGGIAEGKLRVVADHALHARGRSEPFELDDAEEEELDVDVTLEAAAWIRGTVTDGQQAVDGAAVKLRRVRGNEQRQFGDFMTILGLPRGGEETYSSQGGSFEYARVPEGTYALRAEKRGYSESSEKEVIVVPGAEITVELIVSPGGTIGGVVQDTAGLPLLDVRVRLLKERSDAGVESARMAQMQRALGGAYRSARTDGEGRFTFDGLADGTYAVLAEARGFLPAERNNVRPGETDLVLVSVPAATLRGVVVDQATGIPISLFQATVERTDDPEPADERWWTERQVRDAEGRFVRDDLEPGVHRVRVRARGYLPDERQVVLGAGEAQNVTFSLRRGGLLSGRIIDATTGRPIADARIALSDRPPPAAIESSGEEGVRRRERGSSREDGDDAADDADDDARAAEEWFRETLAGDAARSRADGSFELDAVPPGPQTVVIAHDDFVNEYRGGVEVATGEALALEFALRRGVRLSGSVVDGDGVPTPGVMVVIRGTGEENSGTVKTTFSDGEGAFRLAGLEKGSYRLQAFAGGGRSAEDVELSEDVSDYRLETGTQR